MAALRPCTYSVHGSCCAIQEVEQPVIVEIIPNLSLAYGAQPERVLNIHLFLETSCTSLSGSSAWASRAPIWRVAGDIPARIGEWTGGAVSSGNAL